MAVISDDIISLTTDNESENNESLVVFSNVGGEVSEK
jgi:hypothetical protein